MAATRLGSVLVLADLATLAAFAGFLAVVPITASLDCLEFSRLLRGALPFFLDLVAGMGGKDSTGWKVRAPRRTPPRQKSSERPLSPPTRVGSPPPQIPGG